MHVTSTRPVRRRTIVGLLAASRPAGPAAAARWPAAPAPPATPANVYIVHGIPSVGNVDVCANGSTTLVADVAFKGVAKVSVAAGTYDLTVKATNAAPAPVRR